jgi:hypothetical protein
MQTLLTPASRYLDTSTSKLDFNLIGKRMIRLSTLLSMGVVYCIGLLWCDVTRVLATLAVSCCVYVNKTLSTQPTVPVFPAKTTNRFVEIYNQTFC